MYFMINLRRHVNKVEVISHLPYRGGGNFVPLSHVSPVDKPIIKVEVYDQAHDKLAEKAVSRTVLVEPVAVNFAHEKPMGQENPTVADFLSSMDLSDIA